MQLPEDFKNKYHDLLGDDYQSFIDSFDDDSYNAFRTNPLKPKADVHLDRSRPIAYTENGYYGKVSGKTVEHQSGYVYSQEPSAMYVAEVANPTPGDKVLDLCAAPGGKSTHLAGLMQNKGLLVSNEIDRGRAKVLVENLERFGVFDPLILNEDPKTLSKHFPRYFDKILIDAPCSGEGMFRKNHEATKYWSKDYPRECAIRQKEIVAEAIKMLKPGGQLIYSTCTFAPEEDEQIIAWILDNYDFKTLPIKKYDGMVSGKPEWADGNEALKNTIRLFPHLFKGDGHFIAKLQSLSSGKSKKIKHQTGNASTEVRREWEEFCKRNFQNDFYPHHLLEFGKMLSSFNPEIPNLNGLKVMRPGTPLGMIKKNRIEPAYALALAINPHDVKNVIEIDDNQWDRYVHGDTITVDAKLKKGWYLIQCRSMNIGFGKVVNGTLKNFFPKGLRFKV